jgi:zinc transporter ZupT
MDGMKWYSILHAAKLLGTAAVIVGVIAIVIFSRASQNAAADDRLQEKWALCGPAQDFLKILIRRTSFSNWPTTPNRRGW